MARTNQREERSLATPRVLQAQRELVLSIKESTAVSGNSRDEAQVKLSALFCELWNDVESALSEASPGAEREEEGLKCHSRLQV